MSATELRGGRYVIVKPLGEGTQGETFEAVDKRAGRLVALKRFRVGKAKAWKDGALVLVMDRIDGESLAELRKKGFRASVSDVQRLLADASRALIFTVARRRSCIAISSRATSSAVPTARTRSSTSAPCAID